MRIVSELILAAAIGAIGATVLLFVSTAKAQEVRTYTDNGQTYQWVVNPDRSITVTVDGKTFTILAADAEPGWYE